MPQRTRALDTGKFSVTGVSSAGSLNDHRSRRSPRTRMCPCAATVANICTRRRTRGQCSGRPNATACRARVTRPYTGHECRRRAYVPPSMDRRRTGKRRARLGLPRRTLGRSVACRRRTVVQRHLPAGVSSPTTRFATFRHQSVAIFFTVHRAS